MLTRRCLSIPVRCISAAVKVGSRLLGLMEHRLDRPGVMCSDDEQWLLATQLLFSRMVGVRHRLAKQTLQCMQTVSYIFLYI